MAEARVYTADEIKSAFNCVSLLKQQPEVVQGMTLVELFHVTESFKKDEMPLYDYESVLMHLPWQEDREGIKELFTELKEDRPHETVLAGILYEFFYEGNTEFLSFLLTEMSSPEQYVRLVGEYDYDFPQEDPEDHAYEENMQRLDALFSGVKHHQIAVGLDEIVYQFYTICGAITEESDITKLYNFLDGILLPLAEKCAPEDAQKLIFTCMKTGWWKGKAFEVLLARDDMHQPIMPEDVEALIEDLSEIDLLDGEGKSDRALLCVLQHAFQQAKADT